MKIVRKRSELNNLCAHKTIDGIIKDKNMSENRYKSSAVRKSELLAGLADEESGFNEIKGTQRFSGEEAIEVIAEAQAVPEDEKSVEELRAERYTRLQELEVDDALNPAMAMAFEDAFER
jgi:hypothetical protein